MAERFLRNDRDAGSVDLFRSEKSLFGKSEHFDSSGMPWREALEHFLFRQGGVHVRNAPHKAVSGQPSVR
jgi:hypothetical protein